MPSSVANYFLYKPDLFCEELFLEYERLSCYLLTSMISLSPTFLITVLAKLLADYWLSSKWTRDPRASTRTDILSISRLGIKLIQALPRHFIAFPSQFLRQLKTAVHVLETPAQAKNEIICGIFRPRHYPAPHHLTTAMLFSNIISSVLSTVIFGAILAHAQTLAPGRYRISNGEQSARSYPGTGPGYKSVISMSDQFASIWEQWDVSSDGNGGYLIQSSGTGARAYAEQNLNAQVYAASDDQTTWFIENKGNNGLDDLYAIKIPFQDLLWTNTPRDEGDNIIELKGSVGSTEQRFVFQTV